MSQQANQISQYKNATKLLNKKCQALEAQLNESKSNYEKLQKTFIVFLESISSPFNDTNKQPPLSPDGLRLWWSQVSQSPQTKGKEANESSPPLVDDATKDLQKRIDELSASLKEMEIEKNNAEYALSKRQDEVIALNDSLQSLKREGEEKEAQFQAAFDENRQAKAALTSLQDHMTHMLIDLSDLVTSDVAVFEEKKAQMLDATSSLLEKCDESVKSTSLDTVSSLVEQIQTIKQAASSAQETVRKHQELAAKQESYIKQMESSLQSNQSQIASLQEELSAEHAHAAEEGSDGEVAELEEANANLRTALRNAKERMELQQKKQHTVELQLLQLQEQLVAVQENGNELVQQALQTAKRQKEELEKRLAAEAAAREKKEAELEAAQQAWEAAAAQYEQELSVLRSRKQAAEQQMSVSEKFLQEQNLTHRGEVGELQEQLAAAEEELKEAKCQLLEKEAELEAAQQASEEAAEQLKGRVGSLTEQLRAMQAKLSSQQSTVMVSKKREAELEKEMSAKLSVSIREMEEKDKEIIRQQQKGYEEEVKRIRDQVQSLTHQLEEERKNTKKMRETVAQLNEIFESQDRQIEILRSDVTMRDSELMAGKEQIRKLSMLLVEKMATPN